MRCCPSASDGCEGFDSAAQRENYLLFKKKNPDAEYYSSLINMSVALSACIVLAFLGAAAQFSLGFVCHPIATAICLSAGITTFDNATLPLDANRRSPSTLARWDWRRKAKGTFYHKLKEISAQRAHWGLSVATIAIQFSSFFSE
jgi:hypothetical protein